MDVLRLATRLSLGLVGLLAAWYGASGTVVFKDQVAWIAGAVLAVLVAATGGAAWVLSALGAVGRERRWLRDEIRARRGAPAPGSVRDEAAGYVTAKGMTRYHRAGCDVVLGKPVRPVQDRELAVALKPCGMCLS